MTTETITAADLTTPALYAVESTSGWSVSDSAGGRWWPSDEAAEEIEASDDPAATAVSICTQSPMRGWSVSGFGGVTTSTKTTIPDDPTERINQCVAARTAGGADQLGELCKAHLALAKESQTVARILGTLASLLGEDRVGTAGYARAEAGAARSDAWLALALARYCDVSPALPAAVQDTIRTDMLALARKAIEEGAPHRAVIAAEQEQAAEDQADYDAWLAGRDPATTEGQVGQ